MSNEVAIPESMRDLLAKRLEDQKQHENTGSKVVYVSTKGKRFKIGDEKLPDKFDVIIAAAAFEKTYYEDAYDPEVKATPSCYALSLSDPTEPNVQSPNPQSKSCIDCPHNEFGSAKIGKGKACKDARRLMMFAWNETSGADFSQVAQLKVAASSLKAWGAYCSMVRRRYGLPFSWVITTVSLDDDADYPQLVFDCKGPVEDKNEVLEVEARSDELTKMSIRPFKLEDEETNTKPAPKSSTRSKMG